VLQAAKWCRGVAVARGSRLRGQLKKRRRLHVPYAYGGAGEPSGSANITTRVDGRYVPSAECAVSFLLPQALACALQACACRLEAHAGGAVCV